MDGMGGLGAAVSYSATVDGEYTEIENILKAKEPELAAKDIDIPPALGGDGHHGHTPGSDDSAVAGFSVPYSAAQHAALSALRRLKKFFKFVSPDDGTVIFQGYITKVVKSEITVENLITSDVEIQPSAAPALS